jgi:hypothetical protein
MQKHCELIAAIKHFVLEIKGGPLTGTYKLGHTMAKLDKAKGQTMIYKILQRANYLVIPFLSHMCIIS